MEAGAEGWRRGGRRGHRGLLGPGRLGCARGDPQRLGRGADPARASLGGPAAGTRSCARGGFRVSDGFISPLDLIGIGLVLARGGGRASLHADVGRGHPAQRQPDPHDNYDKEEERRCLQRVGWRGLWPGQAPSAGLWPGQDPPGQDPNPAVREPGQGPSGGLAPGQGQLAGRLRGAPRGGVSDDAASSRAWEPARAGSRPSAQRPPA